MEQVKFYSSKSNAKRAAAKAGINLETAVLIEDGKGGFAYTAPVEDAADKTLVAECGHTNCPGCGVHLSNGVMTYDHLESEEGPVKAYSLQKHEFSCMGCGAEWGNVVAEPQAAPATVATGTGLKIEKVREERNGLKRPSVGGVCRAIWDFCDAHQASTGFVPTAKEIKAAAEVEGWNANNASIEYYNWRKFMGIRGRQPKA